MTAGSPSTATGAFPDQRTGSGSRRLGILAFAFAVFFAALPWLVQLIFAATATGGSDYTGVAIVAFLLHVAGMLAALTMGVLAVVNRRGRAWGIAAIVISVLFSQTVVGIVLAIVGGLSTQA
jgi:hypothetical protein